MARSSYYAWVLQNSACLEARDVLSNVMVGLLAGRTSWHEAALAAREALDAVELGHLAGARASELSGGELQRMTIARALAQRRAVILADEPTGQLDYSTSRVVSRGLRRLVEAGQCVVVATHDTAIADMCDRVLEVRDGRVSGR